MKEQIAQQPPVTVKRASATPEERTRRLYPLASPHYTGHATGIRGEDQQYTTVIQAQGRSIDSTDAEIAAIGDVLTALLSSLRQRGRQPSQYQDEVEALEAYHIGMPRSAIRYTQAYSPSPPAAQIPRRITRTPVQTHEEELPATRWRVHWLVFVGIAMFVMVLGWAVLGAVANWWQTTQDDWHYGRPRTFQMDAVVGHNDSTAHPSHFIAVNLHRQIEVIEFPGGDPTHARVYLGPTLSGDGEDLAPATLSFRDVNGDGKPDMLIQVQDTTFVFINDNGMFRPARPDEPMHLPG